MDILHLTKLLVIELLVTAVLVIIYCAIIKPFWDQLWYWRQGIPGTYIPIFGAAREFSKDKRNNDPFRYVHSLFLKHGPIFHHAYGPSVRLQIAEPSLVHHILSKKMHNYTNNADAAFLVQQNGINGGTVLNTEGSTHKLHRALLSPAFAFNSLQSLKPLIARIANSNYKQLAIQVAENGRQAFDLIPKLFDVSLEVLIAGFFSSSSDASVELLKVTGQGANKLQEAVINYSAAVAHRLPVLHWFSKDTGMRSEEVAAACSELSRGVRAVIEERRSHRKRDAAAKVEGKLQAGVDLLDAVIDATDRGEINETDAWSEACSMIIVGYESTATLLSWTIYEMTKNPEQLSKANAMFADATGDDLTEKQQEYLDGCLHESLRLHPPILHQHRVAVLDHTISTSEGREIKIKKGSSVYMNLSEMHRYPAYWGEDALEFRPERFMGKQSKKLAASFLPFSAGSRTCLGQRFALLSARVMLASFLKNFQCKLEDANIVTQFGGSCKPKAMRVRLTVKPTVVTDFQLEKSTKDAEVAVTNEDLPHEPSKAKMMQFEDIIAAEPTLLPQVPSTQVLAY